MWQPLYSSRYFCTIPSTSRRDWLDHLKSWGSCLIPCKWSTLAYIFQFTSMIPLSQATLREIDTLLLHQSSCLICLPWHISHIFCLLFVCLSPTEYKFHEGRDFYQICSLCFQQLERTLAWHMLLINIYWVVKWIDGRRNERMNL